ncbi:MAG: glucosyl-3-phosphoglycerate synthase [Bacteroidota bacterium]
MATKLFRKVIVPLLEGCDSQASVRVARALARNKDVVLVGIIHVKEGESLSTGALPARALRKTLRDWRAIYGVRADDQIRVANYPWEELIAVVHEEDPELLILEAEHFTSLGVSLGEALRRPPCNVAAIVGELPGTLNSVLVPIRGGPSSELTLRIGLSMARGRNAGLHTIHVVPSAPDPARDAPFQAIDRVLKNLPEVQQRQLYTDDPAATILEESATCDLLIMGATIRPTEEAIGIGPIAEQVLHERQGATVIARIHGPLPADMESALVGQNAISVLVDKWFAENTFHAEEFSDLRALLKLKHQQNLTVSLALPALNEEETVGTVIRTVKSELMERVPLLDEIVLMDSNSVDRTREIATELGVPVYIHQEILPAHGARPGKGEGLWKSLYVTHGDILLWIDTDIVNINPSFVYGLLGPLLMNRDVLFVKGYYQRPLKVDGKMQAGGGGRVTELTARPLLNLFYPELSGMIQPLSGEYGGRRSALEGLPFSSGYGVEIGLLIDIFEKYGLRTLAQVDLSERIHHNQPLDSLSRMSFAIIQTVVRRLERRYGNNILDDINKTMKSIRYDQGNLFLQVNEIAELERPPMLELEEYRRRFPPRV